MNLNAAFSQRRLGSFHREFHFSEMRYGAAIRCLQRDLTKQQEFQEREPKEPNPSEENTFINTRIMGISSMSNGELLLPRKQTQTATSCRLMAEVSAVLIHSPRHPSPFPGQTSQTHVFVCLFETYSANITAETLFALSRKHLRSITEP